MAEPDRAPDEAPTADEQMLEFDIYRDAQFRRFAADDIFVFGRIDDLVLSVIEQGPTPVKLRPPRERGSLGRGQLGLQPTFTELAQVVLSPLAASTMALQVIEYCAAAGQIDIPEFRSRINAVLDRHDDSGATVLGEDEAGA